MSDSIGSDFEDFLEKEGIAEEVSLLARERVRAWLLAQDPVSESPPAMTESSCKTHQDR